MNGFVPWPPELARDYRKRGIWKGIPLGEALDTAAREHGGRVAVVDVKRSLTFTELRDQARRLASSFIALGICDGARVVLQLPNTAEFAVVYLAALKVGAVPIACLPHHRQAEIQALANLAEAHAWIMAPRHRAFDCLAMARSLAPEIPSIQHLVIVGDEEHDGASSVVALVARGSADDPALARHVPDAAIPAILQLSGGTTGTSKLIPRTHDDYLYNCLAFAEATGFTGEDVLLVPIPIAHNFPLACPGLQAALLLGARTVLAESPAASAVFPLAARERATWIPAVPATLMQWTQDPTRTSYDLSSIKSIYVGGQRLNPEAARAAVAAFGPVVRQVFGMAEGLLCATRPADDIEIHMETQGRPVCELDELRIVDEGDHEVAIGELGELQCRGAYTIRGYYRAHEHNKAAFTADGFYRTGDMVRRHPSGNLVVEGRKKDLINRGGEKISAEEIEGLIMKHGSVANVALVAIPDAVLGERACACVVLNEGAALSLPALVAFLRDEQRIASFKLPERLEIFQSFPLTGVGKVSKKDLRSLVSDRLSAVTSAG